MSDTTNTEPLGPTRTELLEQAKQLSHALQARRDELDTKTLARELAVQEANAANDRYMETHDQLRDVMLKFRTDHLLLSVAADGKALIATLRRDPHSRVLDSAVEIHEAPTLEGALRVQ